MNDLKKNESNKKNNFISKIKTSFTGRKFRSGAYATIITTIVIGMVLVVNLFTSELDLKFDVSAQDMYTITDQTTELVKAIDDDITMYYLVSAGDELDMFEKIIEKYDALSSNITVVKKDPVLYPKFTSQFVEDEVTENSILIVNNSNGRAKYVDYQDMLVTEYDTTTYEPYTSAVDVEGQISSAIQYVTTTDLPIMYTVEGHGEFAIGETLTSSLEKQNVTVSSLSTLTVKSIPEDCSILFINAPEYDYTEDEVTMIKDYMAAGGDVIITLDFTAEGLVNFSSLLAYYGLDVVEGVIYEADAGHYMGSYANYLAPDVLSHSITSEVISNGKYIIVPGASGLTFLDNTRSSLTIEPLLTTSDTAYSKTNINAETISKEDGDIEGPFTVGAIATDTYNDITTNLIVYSSAYMLDESMTTISAVGNVDLFLNTISYLSGTTSSLSIKTRSIIPEQVTLLASQKFFWGTIVVIVIPLIILVIGIVICIRRRRK